MTTEETKAEATEADVLEVEEAPVEEAKEAPVVDAPEPTPGKSGHQLALEEIITILDSDVPRDLVAQRVRNAAAAALGIPGVAAPIEKPAPEAPAE